MVAVIMGLRECVLGFLVLVVFEHVYSARLQPRVSQPRVLTEEPQRVDSLLREQWSPIRGPYDVQSQRPQLAPLTTDLTSSSIQSKQELQGPVRELTWKFPKVPEEPVQLDINFDLQQPQPSDSVAVQCWENRVHVEVKQDFFGTGQLLEPSLLSLGGCAVVNVDSVARVLIFQSELHECGSQLVVTDNELVYIFTLDYRPAEFQSTPIVRSSAATVGIECHYPRRHNVSSNELQPAWIPYVSTKVAEDILVFSLKIMTDDWLFERPSKVFFLGDVLNIQASVKPYNHAPFIYLWTTVLPLQALRLTLLQCILLSKIMVASLMQSILAPCPTFCPECTVTNSSFSWRPSGSNKKPVVLFTSLVF
ncbi:hypothetical protein G5714_024738 [Onychostoma macrolepis]|uniref:Zona pellucida sperm-binding protein 3 n=1 Tax=Onychostoma macrolepis TaxID=369639 RepID=A0A7J6BI03_9TELE|nr:hypothetical protein G5714_024738 [Onychostoma macrolepis]